MESSRPAVGLEYHAWPLSSNQYETTEGLEGGYKVILLFIHLFNNCLIYLKQIFSEHLVRAGHCSQ